MKPIAYRTVDHGTFEGEWGLHRGVSEWWYATGIVKDRHGRMFSYQFTILSLRVYGGLRPKVLMLALTDVGTQKHYYTQIPSILGRELSVTDRSVIWGEQASVRKGENGMTLSARAGSFSYDLELDYGKGAVWHCENGVLRMGVKHPEQTTTYYSYTNMPTSGTLTIDGEPFAVEGATWFDKQGGTFSITNPGTHWEWFSFRFFDDEEIMLFSFPQSDHQDGTFIPKDGASRRLTDYTITPTGFTVANGMTFSSGWEVEIPGVKDERYRLTPLMDGQLNFSYFEQLAGVSTGDGTLVGYCFVELLPGVLNKAISAANVFKRIDG